MFNIVVYNIVVKAVELLTLPSPSKILDIVSLLATPLSLPEKKFKATDAIGDYITLNVPPRAFSNVPLQIWSL